MQRQKKIRIVFLFSFIIMFVAALALFFVWNGIILLNNPLKEKYPIRGVDVSSYQGDIDWKILSQENIKFAFIKATEGSSYVDEYFKYNYEQAQKTDLRISAYHFFSFDSPGKTQAENFIKTVAVIDNMLPPVVDFEFYEDKEKNLPDINSTRKELQIFINLLEQHYGIKPIIYATEKSYRLYIEKSFDEYDIWIRNVITTPTLSDGRDWTFWQYTNRNKLKGYQGDEKFIDMNVFSGSKEDFYKYAK